MKLQDIINYLAFSSSASSFSADNIKRFFQVVAQLSLENGRLNDHCMLVLRKFVFHKELKVRHIALFGYLEFLDSRLDMLDEINVQDVGSSSQRPVLPMPSGDSSAQIVEIIGISIEF